jgi:hypothetical protein
MVGFNLCLLIFLRAKIAPHSCREVIGPRNFGFFKFIAKTVKKLHLKYEYKIKRTNIETASLSSASNGSIGSVRYIENYYHRCTPPGTASLSTPGNACGSTVCGICCNSPSLIIVFS